jgi:hypothetical protein
LHAPSGPVSPAAPVDAGWAPSAESGATQLAVVQDNGYPRGHVFYVMGPHMLAVDACVAKVPAADFNQGTEVLNLADQFEVTLDARGNVVRIAHPTDHFSRALDACVQPILHEASWGPGAGDFKIALVSRRKR